MGYLSLIHLLVFGFLFIAPTWAFAGDFPFLALRSVQHSSLANSGEVGEASDRKPQKTDSMTMIYGLIAYVTKAVLDDGSYEYRLSPIGTYLGKETPAQYSRSGLASLSSSMLFLDSPSSLRYRVRPVTTLGDLWSAFHVGPEEHASLSVDPKLGAGKAGFVVSLRW
jgi:hypothetical protein